MTTQPGIKLAGFPTSSWLPCPWQEQPAYCGQMCVCSAGKDKECPGALFKALSLWGRMRNSKMRENMWENKVHSLQLFLFFLLLFLFIFLSLFSSSCFKKKDRPLPSFFSKKGNVCSYSATFSPFLLIVLILPRLFNFLKFYYFC